MSDLQVDPALLVQISRTCAAISSAIGPLAGPPADALRTVGRNFAPDLQYSARAGHWVSSFQQSADALAASWTETIAGLQQFAQATALAVGTAESSYVQTDIAAAGPPVPPR